MLVLLASVVLAAEADEAAPEALTAGAAEAAPAARGDRPPVVVTDPRVWIGLNASGSVGATDVAGGGGGFGVEAGARLGKAPRRSIALLARVRESVLTGPLRNVGNIEVQVQYPAGTGVHATVGFSHNHEALGTDWLADPLGVTAGVATTITHRSGAELGAGWNFAPPFRQNAALARFRPHAELTGHVFPAPGGVVVYGVAEVGIRFGLDGLFGE